jgi:hypothetical protein
MTVEDVRHDRAIAEDEQRGEEQRENPRLTVSLRERAKEAPTAPDSEGEVKDEGYLDGRKKAPDGCERGEDGKNVRLWICEEIMDAFGAHLLEASVRDPEREFVVTEKRVQLVPDVVGAKAPIE